MLKYRTIITGLLLIWPLMAGAAQQKRPSRKTTKSPATQSVAHETLATQSATRPAPPPATQPAATQAQGRTLTLLQDDYPVGEGSPAEHGALSVWACPPNCKINPITGNALEDGAYAASEETGSYRNGNAVWDGNKHRVALFAGRSDCVGFQLVLQNTENRPLTNITIRLRGIWQDSGMSFREIEAARVAMFWEWYSRDKVGTYWPDALLPIEGPLAIPNAANGIISQRVQPVYVNLYVPRETTPGMYVVALQVQAQGVNPFLVPIDLTVQDFTLPDTLSFNVNVLCPETSKALIADSPDEMLEIHALETRNRINLIMPADEKAGVVNATGKLHQSANVAVNESSTALRLACINAWLADTKSIDIRQGLAPDEAYAIAEAGKAALFYPGERFGDPGLYGSLRLKALRDGQQDVECLMQLAKQLKATPKELAAALAQVLGMDVSDSATSPLDGLTPDNLVQMRRIAGYNLHATTVP